MKKIFLLIILFCFFLFACNKEGQLDHLNSSYDVVVGEEVTLDIPKKAGIRMDSDLVYVQGYTFKFIKPGSFGLEVTLNKEKKIINFNIKPSITQEDISGFVGEEISIQHLSKFTFSYETDIFEITNNKLKLLKAGTAVLMIKNYDEVKEIKVTVKEINKLIVTYNLKVRLGDSFVINAYVENVSNPDITYQLLDDLLEENGKEFKAIKKGTAEIKVSYQEQSVLVKVEITEKPKIVLEEKLIECTVGDQITINARLENAAGELSYYCSSDLISMCGNKISCEKPGVCVVTISYLDIVEMVTLEIEELVGFEVSDFELYVGEEMPIDVNVTMGSINDIIFTTEGDKIELVDGIVKGVNVGKQEVIIQLKKLQKVITITVKRLAINVNNESLVVDVLDTLELDIEYPEYLSTELEYTVVKKNVCKIKNNVIYPLSGGKTQVRIYLKGHEEIRKIINVEVVVDPLKVIEALHIEEVLMRSDVKTYGATVVSEKVMGSVSKYLFSDLNLISKIINIYDNPYVGMVATYKIVTELDETGKPRTGVLKEQIKSITYHDTANNQAGADALMHANYMVGAGISYRSRSWNYTVDSKCVIQHIPDNEVTYQGDKYEAYATSIGIETCINRGSNLNLVWQRMGKLCAMLLAKYDLGIENIYQHNYWNGKDCPHTLRANGLYDYAIDYVRGELLALRALDGYELKFTSLDPEYLDNSGIIIKAPEQTINVGYKVEITNNEGYKNEITLHSIVTPLK